MTDFEHINEEKSLMPLEKTNGADTQQEYMNEFKAQAQEYGQKFQDAASKAKDFANEKFSQASEKFKELQGKDPKEFVEDAKEYARQKPGQALLISAVVGLAVGLLIKGRR